MFDTVILGGTVVDGTGAPRRRADVGIRDGRVEAIGSLPDADARARLDASGLIVAPGFVDTHVHSEIALLGHGYRFGSVLQGVTTHFTSPDGFGWAPLPPELAHELWQTTLFAVGHAPIVPHWRTIDSYLSVFPGNTPVNIAPQAPHCAIRLGAMGWAGRAATEGELEAMKGMLEAWLDAGAVAISLGLDYQPSAFADLRELVALAKVAGGRGAVYNAHIRNNILGREGAWRETLEIGRRSGTPVHIAHEYVNEVTEPLLDAAPAICDLSFESYLYPAGSTHLQFALPTWAQQGGQRALRARLEDPVQRRQIRDAMQQALSTSVASGTRQVIAANRTGRYIGMTLDEAAAAEGEMLGDFAVRMFEEEEPYVLTINHRPGGPEVHDRMVELTARHPLMMVASDGIYHGPHPHPRALGCHARVLRMVVRERKLLSLEQAVHKMTGMPAERFHLDRRGMLKPGYGADIVLFDEATVADRSTWDEPLLEPVGIRRVLVNGETVIEDGRPTGKLPGRIVTRQSRSA
ncbi:MAG: amidohydrolase family protein [SAR202 cluster bacterium]|nr:amidohydrolase family protein [SAR202 cluster bacterium]